MKRLRLGLSVWVTAYDHDDKPIDPPIRGVVVRERIADNGAWVKLEERRKGIHYPFPEDDEHDRGCHVLAYPELCSEVRP